MYKSNCTILALVVLWGGLHMARCIGPGNEARSSTVYTNNIDSYGPQFAIDGKISNTHHTFFHSRREDYPWIEIILPFPMEIYSVIMVNRNDCCGERLKNAEIRTGMTSIPGRITNRLWDKNTVCGIYFGPGTTGENSTIHCANPILSKYITIQLRDRGSLQLNEVIVNQKTGIYSRSSTVYENNINSYGPQFAIDGEISNTNSKFFHSSLEDYPWIEIILPFPIEISSVTMVNRNVCCGERLKNAEIRTGMISIPGGITNRLSDINTICGVYLGPGTTGENSTIDCASPILAKYITIQLRDRGILQLNEVIVNPQTGNEARSSTVYGNNMDSYGPHFAIDGEISNTYNKFFHSSLEDYPWIEIILPFPMEISSVTMVNRNVCCGERLKNVEIRTGMISIPGGITNRLWDINTVCGLYLGPGTTGEKSTIDCANPILAKYITIQLRDRGILQLNEVIVNQQTAGRSGSSISDGLTGGKGSGAWSNFRGRGGGAIPASCIGSSTDWTCCSSSSPCREKQGDCDNDNDCYGSLICGNNNCKNFNSLAQKMSDCCIAPKGQECTPGEENLPSPYPGDTVNTCFCTEDGELACTDVRVLVE